MLGKIRAKRSKKKKHLTFLDILFKERKDLKKVIFYNTFMHLEEALKKI